MLTASQFATLRLARTARVGPVTYRRLTTRYGGAQEVIRQWPTIAKPGHTLADEKALTAEIKATEAAGGWFLFQEDPQYPESLATLADAPLVLSGLGDKTALNHPTVAIVGTRNASAAGMRWVEELATTLAQKGYSIASGLARGMDGAAHTGALNAGGLTVAVLGGGADQLYPPEHRLLKERIATSGGAIVSEQPWGTPSRAELFPRRNRIIAGLSRAVAVAEASRHSGSLITAEYALEYGREVFAVPGNPTDPRAAGPNWLLKNGANLLESAEDILTALTTSVIPVGGRVAKSHFAGPQPHTGTTPANSSQSSLFEETLSPPQNPQNPNTPKSQNPTLLDYLSPTPADLDTLIRTTGKPESTLTAELTELELLGQATRTPDGRWSLT